MPFRLLPALALSCALLVARPADAKMMLHYDVAGLLLQSDAVVIAERTGAAATPDGATPYRVIRSLRGPLKPGDVVEVYDRHYDTRGKTLDPQVVLFLGTSSGKRHLVASGLRVLENGKVWRFEQHSNPGPYTMVPQGKDPQDQWGNGGAQLDLVGFEKAIAEATKRIAVLTAAKAITDPAKRRAAVLALFTEGASSGGFYTDVLAERARELLAKAGDLEGALLVELRDRGGSWRSRDWATLDRLVAIAIDASKPIEVRVVALDVSSRGFELSSDFVALRVIAKLIDDPAPLVRAAAVRAAAQPANVSTSDGAQQRKLDAVVAEIRALVAKRYATETDPRVLAAILGAYQNSFRKPPPAKPTGPRLVAVATGSGGYLGADVYCVRPARITGSELHAKSSTGVLHKPAFNVHVHCDNSASTGGLADGTSLPAGRYELIVTLSIAGGGKEQLAIGSLVVDASGERRVVP